MKKNILLLLSASTLIHSSVNLLAPIYALYIKNIGGTLFDAGVTIGFYAILKGLLYFIFKKLFDKRPSKELIFSGYFLFFIGYVLYIFASNPLHVFGIQAILAIGEVIVNPSWSAVIAKSLDKGKERKIYSDFFGYRSIFEGIAAIIGGLVAFSVGFDVVFIIMAVFSIIASIISLFINE